MPFWPAGSGRFAFSNRIGGSLIVHHLDAAPKISSMRFVLGKSRGERFRAPTLIVVFDKVNTPAAALDKSLLLRRLPRSTKRIRNRSAFSLRAQSQCPSNQCPTYRCTSGLSPQSDAPALKTWK